MPFRYALSHLLAGAASAASGAIRGSSRSYSVVNRTVLGLTGDLPQQPTFPRFMRATAAARPHAPDQRMAPDSQGDDRYVVTDAGHGASKTCR